MISGAAGGRRGPRRAACRDILCQPCAKRLWKRLCEVRRPAEEPAARAEESDLSICRFCRAPRAAVRTLGLWLAANGGRPGRSGVSVLGCFCGACPPDGARPDGWKTRPLLRLTRPDRPGSIDRRYDWAVPGRVGSGRGGPGGVQPEMCGFHTYLMSSRRPRSFVVSLRVRARYVDWRWPPGM